MACRPGTDVADANACELVQVWKRDAGTVRGRMPVVQ